MCVAACTCKCSVVYIAVAAAVGTVVTGLTRKDA